MLFAAGLFHLDNTEWYTGFLVELGNLEVAFGKLFDPCSQGSLISPGVDTHIGINAA